MTCALGVLRGVFCAILLTTVHFRHPRYCAAAAAQGHGHSSRPYQLSLGDVVPFSTFGGASQNVSYNFVTVHLRLVGTGVWPVSPELAQSLHYAAKEVSSATGFVFQCHLSTNREHAALAGPCHEECSLKVYPQVADVSACQRCGQLQTAWHNKDYASLDLTVVKNYTRDSMLIGTAMTTIARSVTKSLQSNGLKAHCYVLMYEPQPDAALIAQYKPLAMLALKAEGWDLSFTVSGDDVIPFGLENENRILVALNALELMSLFTSYWRFKSIDQDRSNDYVTVHVTCIRQPDRHGQMNTEEAMLTIQQLQHKLQADDIAWRLKFLRARRAPEESLSYKFRQMVKSPLQSRSSRLWQWALPAFITALLAAVLALLLLGSPGMIILPGRTSTYGSDTSTSSFSMGTRLLLKNTSHGTKIAQSVPLIMGDCMEKADIEICQKPDGSGDWLLGKGASGRVYKGIKNGVQDVAVKVLITVDDMQVKLFQEEIKLLRSVSFDRNIVQFCGACLQPNDTMMILEYMAGGDLMRAIGEDTKNELRWSRKGGLLMLDIARGLTYLHANRLIHMDLKSKNILLNGAKDLAKIADVGLSRIIQSTLGGQNSDPYGVGTFEYTAPEILLGRPCSEKVDVYSFGVIMWEVVSHEQPARGRMRSLKVPQECPADIDELISSCLSESPANRPTAKEAYHKLKAWKDRHAAKVSKLLENSRQKRSSQETPFYTDSGKMEFSSVEDLDTIPRC